MPSLKDAFAENASAKIASAFKESYGIRGKLRHPKEATPNNRE
jgi:hypothetical protein